MAERDPRPGGGATGHSRRNFLRGSGLAAASAVLTHQATTALDEARADEQEASQIVSGTTTITLDVNGQEMRCEIEPRTTLLDALRDRLEVTGPKRVCDRASCGACTVILDGEPVYSCTTLAITCQDQKIETAESFGTDEGSVPYEFHRHDALMCGYCTPGFVTACKAYLDKNNGKEPTLDEIKAALDGNICRCGTYIGVFEAALAAAKSTRGGA